MTDAKKIARRVLREWCKANGLVIYPMAAADLVARIELALTEKSQETVMDGERQEKTMPYIYFWNRQGRKNQPCEVLVRAKVMNSCLVRFEDGYSMVTSRNAIRKNPPP